MLPGKQKVVDLNPTEVSFLPFFISFSLHTLQVLAHVYIAVKVLEGKISKNYKILHSAAIL